MHIQNFSLRRRTLLVCLVLSAAAPAFAAEDLAAQRIRSFYDVLLGTMKQAKQLGVQGRYEKLAPAIREAFDLPAMTRIAVGPTWTSVPSDQQTALVDAFTRMTIATYASRFDNYSRERFEIAPTVETRGRNRIVHSELVESDGKRTTLNYLMHPAGESWKIADVYLSGTISELAARRSEFSSTLKSGGAPALIDSLRQRAEKLMK